MTDRLHQNSQFVVCRACKRYFFVDEIRAHQMKEHPDFDGDPKDDPYRLFYYLQNNEVTWSLNRLKETKDAVNAVRLLLL